MSDQWTPEKSLDMNIGTYFVAIFFSAFPAPLLLLSIAVKLSNENLEVSGGLAEYDVSSRNGSIVVDNNSSSCSSCC